jgi:hypothetical protein
VRQIYDARSKYVHEGRPITAEHISEAEQVAMHVLWALLKVSGAGRLSSTSEWHTKINYVAAAMKDAREIPETDLDVLGIVASPDERVPPNRVQESPYAGWNKGRPAYTGRHS